MLANIIGEVDDNNDDKIDNEESKKQSFDNKSEMSNEEDEKDKNQSIQYDKRSETSESMHQGNKIIESKKKNKHDVLKKILEMGSDPNIRDSNGWCPLHYACNYGDFESVKILLDYKANIDNYSNNRRIPLHIASNNNFPQIVEYLCQKNQI